MGILIIIALLAIIIYSVSKTLQNSEYTSDEDVVTIKFDEKKEPLPRKQYDTDVVEEVKSTKKKPRKKELMVVAEEQNITQEVAVTNTTVKKRRANRINKKEEKE